MKRVVAAGLVVASLAVTAGAEAQQATKPPKIGVLTDMSSYVSGLAGKGSVVAAQLAVADYEKATGRKVELVSADTQAKPDLALTFARRWFDEEGVDVAVDLPPSSVGLAVQNLARDRNRIAISSAAAALDLVGKQCSETGFQWAYNTVAVSRALATAVVRQGGRSWFFIVQDNAYGASLEQEGARVVTANGGTIKGVVRTPTEMTDFASALLQAQSAGADVIAIGNSGTQAITSIKQAREFGLDKTGKLVGISLLLSEVKGIGLPLAQGLLVTDSFYWDMNERTREWSKRFSDLYDGRKPTSTQAGVYSAVLHYLKARDAAGTADAMKVAAKMRELPVEDFMTDGARILKNGWVERKFYLFEVKKPSESTSEWDLLRVVGEASGADVAPTGMGCRLE